MTTLPELHLAQLLRDYLSTAGSLAAGLPDLATLPRLVMDHGREPTPPSLVIAARESESLGSRRVVEVSVILITWLRTDAAGAAVVQRQTTRSQAATWLRAIDDRLRDHAALAAHLAEQSAAAPEGWCILKVVHRGAAAPMREQDTGRINYALTLSFHLAVSRMTAV